MRVTSDVTAYQWLLEDLQGFLSLQIRVTENHEPEKAEAYRHTMTWLALQMDKPHLSEEVGESC